MKKIHRLAKKFKQTSIVTDNIVEALKEIVDERPELYLDEIAIELGVRKNCFLSLPTLARTLRDRIGYSLQVYSEIATQRNEVERVRYKEALSSLVTDVGQVVFFDKTHKDQNSSRRRRGWGIRKIQGGWK